MHHTGTVQKGEGTGQKLGFPTANIPLTDDSLSGIYAALVRFEGKEYPAAVYADTKRKLLEAHLLDFDGDVYGKELELELKEKVREDRNFADENDARTAIADDVQKVREYFRMP